MNLRPRASLFPTLFVLPFLLLLSACSKIESLSIEPGAGSVTLLAGEAYQFHAYAQEQMGSGPVSTVDVTDSVTWTTSNPNVATISPSGLATAAATGETEIIATSSNNEIAYSSITVASSSTGTAGTPTITVLPGTAAETFAGETTQFIATGNLTGSGSSQNITNQVTWISSNAQVATVNSAGLATAVGNGTTTIIATSGGISDSATVTVTIPTSGSGTGSSIASLTVIPGSQAVSSPGQTTQFLAIGTTVGGSTVNLTNQVAWSSSSAQIATIGAASGSATAVGKGTATIAAIYANSSGGTVVTGTATFTVSGGTSEQYTSVTVIPSTLTISASGQTSQLIALATSGSTGLQTDVTSSSQIVWISSSSTIASVSPSGLITGKNAGATTITAELTNPDGSVVSNIASVTANLTPAPEPLISLTIIPSSMTFGSLHDQGQLLAIGTYATAPYTRDLTNSPNLTWISSLPNDFTVDSNNGGGTGATAGVVTVWNPGVNIPIIAEATNPVDGTIQTATASISCPLVLPNPTGNPPTPGSCFPGSEGTSLISTLTVYNEGLNTTSNTGATPNWLITASSATGTPDVIHCGPGWTANGNTGGSVCTATYPTYLNGTTITGSNVILTAPAQTGVAFGGWSYNCTPSDKNGVPLNPVVITAAGPNYCTVNMTTDETVGAIFN